MEPGVRCIGIKAAPPGYLWSKYECFLMSGCRDTNLSKKEHKTLSQKEHKTLSQKDPDGCRVITIVLLVLRTGELKTEKKKNQRIISKTTCTSSFHAENICKVSKHSMENCKRSCTHKVPSIFSSERLWQDHRMTEPQNDGRTGHIQYSPHFFKAGL